MRLPALLLVMLLVPAVGLSSPVTPAERARLAAGQALLVLVEIDPTSVDRSAESERTRRGIDRDDAVILALRSQGYAVIKRAVETTALGTDARRLRDYEHFPLELWRLSSLDALNRLLRLPAVRAVHRDVRLHVVSVSDLPFIEQPQAAALGATGAGTTVAVIDGGLDPTFVNYSDFGTCSTTSPQPPTCRVVFNQDDYPGASEETGHGTNVAAIALGTAPGANLAMFDVFNGMSASSSDIISALNSIVSMQASYNIVAVNMSLGDSTSNPTQCSSSPFTTAIANVYRAGILPVVAAGNSGSKSGLSDPACVPDVVSVGSVYSGSFGTWTWVASGTPSGQCTDVSESDMVTCFSQSASYLSMLAPGSFVNAPSAAFQFSGTSQATPHVTGAIAVLRARYPRESLSETVQRMQTTGVLDTDPLNNLTLPRLDLLAAVSEGSALLLGGSGPATATTGGTSTYTLTVSDSGPLAATNVRVTDILPAIATVKSLSAGCSLSGSTVSCSGASLAVGGKLTFTITVAWNASGPVYDSASISADQTDISSQNIAFGTVPGPVGDVPLPPWTYGLLAIGLFAALAREHLTGARRHAA